MLTPGEGIVSRSGMSLLGTDGLRALNRWGGGRVVRSGAAVVDIRPQLERIARQMRENADPARRADVFHEQNIVRAFRDAMQKAGGRRR